MWLIATDEAGYGPKLGPLVVAATLWQVPGQQWTDAAGLDTCFAPLRVPIRRGEATFTVDDSKAVFQASRLDGFRQLQAVASASHHWCGWHGQRLVDLVKTIAPRDTDDLLSTPWLTGLVDPPALAEEDLHCVTTKWGEAGVRQLDLLARTITARRLNETCGGGMNKADLLSESTLGLVCDLIRRVQQTHAAGLAQQPILADVYCDRHGGRRYYAGVIQHAFCGATVQVETEHRMQSRYRVRREDLDLRIHFTVKGDRFTPVALSSIHAKYMRECLMQALNRFFALRHRGGTPLKPTAGYPADADRFLREIARTIRCERIEPHQLIRAR